jgi:hypothetical protein
VAGVLENQRAVKNLQFFPKILQKIWQILPKIGQNLAQILIARRRR